MKKYYDVMEYNPLINYYRYNLRYLVEVEEEEITKLYELDNTHNWAPPTLEDVKEYGEEIERGEAKAILDCYGIANSL